MGVALAEAARDRGARVTLVAGPISVEPPHGVALERVTTAAEMERAMLHAARRADVVLMAAAVADYRPARAQARKIKRSVGNMVVELVPNPDILAGVGAKRRPGQVLVGFALETSDGLRRARRKLLAKGLDLVVLNTPRDGLGGETNRVTLVERARHRRLPVLSKREVAEHVLERTHELRAAVRTKAKRGGGGRR
jgi:phosphopantothenoylcysteine decarboxylase/phosphopantothenate--cysteine ligase